MSAIGANPAQLDALARQFDELAHLMSAKRFRLNSWIEGDRFWRGHHANEFRHEWATQYSPQIGRAVDFLNAHVRSLHDNANQQRIASGEQPRDYGSTFAQKLWGAAHEVDKLEHEATHGVEGFVHRLEHDVEGVARHGVRDLEHAGKSLERSVETLAATEYAGLKALGGSAKFQQMLKYVTLANEGLGIIAMLPIPGVQEVAGGLLLVSGGLLLFGHLAEEANTGKFSPMETAEDLLDMAGGGLGAVKAAKDLDIARTAEQRSVRAWETLGPTVESIAGESVKLNSLDGVQTAHRIVSVGVGAYNTTSNVAQDVLEGNYAKAGTDSLGYLSVLGGVVGDDHSNVLLRVPADLGHEGNVVKDAIEVNSSDD